MFVELFISEVSQHIFEAIYPNLTNCNNFGVTVKKLTSIPALIQAFKDLTPPSMEIGKIKKNYILKLANNLKVLPDDFKLNQQLVW